MYNNICNFNKIKSKNVTKNINNYEGWENIQNESSGSSSAESYCHLQYSVTSVGLKLRRFWLQFSVLQWHVRMCIWTLRWEQRWKVLGVMWRRWLVLWWELIRAMGTVCQHTDMMTDSELMILRYYCKPRELPPTPLCLRACVCVCVLLYSLRSTLHGHTEPPPSRCNYWHCSSHWCIPVNGYTHTHIITSKSTQIKH